MVEKYQVQGFFELVILNAVLIIIFDLKNTSDTGNSFLICTTVSQPDQHVFYKHAFFIKKSSNCPKIDTLDQISRNFKKKKYFIWIIQTLDLLVRQ